MGIIGSAVAGAGRALTRAAGRTIKRRFYKKFILILVVLFYLIFLVVMHFSTNATYNSYVTATIGGSSGASGTFDDAGKHKEFLDTNDVVLDDLNSVYMDNKTVGRILAAVDTYNQEVTKTTSVSYEYMTHEGKISEANPITGVATVEPLKEEIITVVSEPQYSKVSVADEAVQRMIAAGVTRDHDGDGFVEIFKGYQDVEHIEELVIEPKSTSNYTAIDINRKTVDADSKHFGEDVFYLRWQPVFTLCTMFMQNNVENFGTYDEQDTDGDSYFLSNAAIQNIIDIFSFHYTFYDDVTVKELNNIPFDRIFQESSGYRLETSVPIEQVNLGEETVTDISIKRVPALAPQFIYNSYLTYSYKYEQVENGYYKLVTRECVLNPQSFLDACSELVEDFDAELFVELLSNLEDTEDLVAYYDKLIHSGKDTYITRSKEECPAIGTYVSNVSGFVAWIFKGNNKASERIEDSQDGIVFAPTEHSYAIPEEALDDEDFLQLYAVAESCLGTPYKFGHSGGPGVSFDCSTFVSYVLKNSGYSFERNKDTRALLAFCTKISDDKECTEVCPGDIVFFQGTYRPGVSHVGIWLGDNQFIHASSSKGVTISKLSDSYYQKHFLCFSRLPAKNS